MRKLSAGDRISEYVLTEMLGQGGFGEVWKAEHHQISGKFVAIKIPTVPESMDLIKKEAVFQHQLDHPNIVHTIGLDTEHDPPYFMMEYVAGQNLRQLMHEDGIMPPPYAIDIVVQILDALTYAHPRGIVHKDIKPENVLVQKRRISTPDNKKALVHFVKITDLGLGKFPEKDRSEMVLSENTRTSGVRLMSGTLFYMAPEQMVPERTIDGRADIYSVGVVLYELLTGELPLGMDLPSELNPVVSADLDRICKRALSIDRDRRYATAKDMVADLVRAKENFVAGLTASGSSVADIPRKPLPMRVTPEVVTAAAMVRSAAPMSVRRSLTWALLALGAILAVLSLYLFGRLHRSVISPVGKQERLGFVVPSRLYGPLTFSTEPEGAAVAFDGAMMGTAPVQIAQVTHERHEVRFSAKFRQDRLFVLEPKSVGDKKLFTVIDPVTAERQVVDCTYGRSFEGIKLALQKAVLKIDTPDLEDVAVYLNGALRGRAPAFEEKDIEAGMYVVKLVKKGYLPVEFPVAIHGGMVVDLEKRMEPEGSEPSAGVAAHVTLFSEPSRAAVLMDGEERGETPVVLMLPVGRHSLRLQLPYHHPFEETLESVQGDFRYRIELRRMRARVTFDSDPQGAFVFEGERRLGVTPFTSEPLEAGVHDVTFLMEGYYPVTESLELVDETAGKMSPKLVRIPPGRLAVECGIPGAEVYVDNKPMGHAPLLLSDMVATKHRIRVLGCERLVSIEPDRETRVVFTLDDVDLLLVPSGEFLFGTRHTGPGDIEARRESTEGYYVDRYEVTNEQYALFLRDLRETGDHRRCHPDEPKGKTHIPAFWEDSRFNSPKQPVVGIDWWDAYAYAAWAGKRLPTEKEWERAARGDKDMRTYPWGDLYEMDRLNGSGSEDGFKDITAPVGSFERGRSPFGAYDTVGNAAEWTADPYDSKSLDRVVRGGSYILREANTVYSRQKERRDYSSRWVGFRCVRDVKRRK